MEIGIEGESTQTLFEASLRGCVSTLNMLLQKDSTILRRISLSSFTETPLHIASLLGHLDFTEALLRHKPDLSAELNSQRQAPLHLASAEGHTGIVKALLIANADVCLIPDQDGRIPLHLAAMRGRVEVIRELVDAHPESVKVKLRGQETVLHLCIRYNHLQALQLLLPPVINESEFINSADRNGHTILQLAVSKRQIETVRYLVSKPEVRVEAEELAKLFSDQDDKGKPLEPTRGNLMIVATVSATLAFQAAVNPPGGVWQTDTKAIENGCPAWAGVCKAGTSILSYNKRLGYYAFTVCNTISFSASVSTVFLLFLSRYRIKRRVFGWLLHLAMSFALVFLSAAYVVSIILVAPPHYADLISAFIFYLYFLGLLFSLVPLYYLLFWPLKKLLIGIFPGKPRTRRSEGSVLRPTGA